MSWLVVIVFTVCTGQGCIQNEFSGPIDPAACLANLADYEAGKAEARVIHIDEGPDAGSVYPIDGVWCLEPVEDDLTPASYPQE